MTRPSTRLGGRIGEEEKDGAMDDAGSEIRRAARERAYSMPIEDIQPADPEMFRSDTLWPYFERLRAEDPVHMAVDDEAGPYWSVTKYNDIMTVDTNHEVFSSQGGITLPPSERRVNTEARSKRAAQSGKNRNKNSRKNSGRSVLKRWSWSGDSVVGMALSHSWAMQIHPGQYGP